MTVIEITGLPLLFDGRERPVGTVIDVDADLAGRLIAAGQATLPSEDAAGGKPVEKMNGKELKALAAERGIALGDASKVDEIRTVVLDALANGNDGGAGESAPDPLAELRELKDEDLQARADELGLDYSLDPFDRDAVVAAIAAKLDQQ